MLTALTIKDFYDDKKRRILKFDRIQLEVIRYNNIHIRHIIYYKYGKNVKWHKIRQLAGNEGQYLLYNNKIEIPENCGLKRYTSNLLKERIAENSATETLKRASQTNKNLSVGIYDKNAVKTELAEILIKYTNHLIIVTDDTENYYSVCQQIMNTSGAVIRIKKDLSALKNISLIIAPQKITQNIPVQNNTVIFTSEKPSVCQNGYVYFRYILSLNDNYREIKPHSLSDEYFAQALYDKGRQYRLGSSLPILCISENMHSTINEISNFLLKNTKE